MTENKSAMRRSTRLFVEEQQLTETGAAIQMGHECKQPAGDEKERERPQREAVTSSSMDVLRLPVVDLGTELCTKFPNTTEEIRQQVVQCLQAANASQPAKRDLRPVNFGIVLPNSIYRSSFPTEEDHEFLATLGLNTVLSLVKKDPFPEHLESFMQSNGIRHLVIDMQGTKKVEIPEAIMHSIMKIALDQRNYPLLIHCNHGKHRTGCAVAVLRHVTGWNIDAVLDEYRGFAEPKIRDCDVEYIRQYQVESLKGLFTNKVRSPEVVLAASKMIRALMLTTILMMIIFITAFFW